MTFAARVRSTPKRGFTYLEVQVALALFMIAISGLGPLAVIQSRQIKRLEERFEPDQTHFLIPPGHEWLRKLSGVAAVSNNPPAPRPTPAIVIDNGDPGYSEVIVNGWAWYNYYGSDAYGGSMRVVEWDSPGNYAIWTFSNLNPGVYTVYITYHDSEYLAVDSPFQIYDGANLLSGVLVDQEEEPSGNSYNGHDWLSLGDVSLQGTSLVVQLESVANDDVGADAVRIVPKRNGVSVTSLTKTSDTENVSAVVSVNVVVN